jgi:tRNA threonylcarbamoyl adenosine modification protein (Sua5/YciO/YrdC/YwlC family)
LPAVLDEAVAALRRGEVVVVPTDTVYGVAVAASVPGATARLFAVKDRPTDVALPVLVADADQAREIAISSPRADALMRAHWPGGLTIVLPRAPGFDVDLGGTDASTVGVRVPDHDVPRELARRVGPLVTTSANRHRRPTPLTAAEVRAELGVDVVIDGGVCDGEPSTVVRVSGESVEILRQGAVVVSAR